MSGWQDDVLGGYLDTVTERGFDGTFLAYLSAAGFSDLHFLHGAYEFGKDFIGRRDGRQWAFQTKAGDLGLSGWREVRAQVEEMLWNDIAHPAFDSTLPRTAVLVTTGRLIGGASAEAQQFVATLTQRTAGLPRASTFEVWDRQTLLSGMQATPSLSLNSWDPESLRHLLGLLADAERRILSVQAIERLTRAWSPGDLYRACIASSVVANTLVNNSRPDLATSVVHGLIRTALLSHRAETSPGVDAALNASRALFRDASDHTLNGVEPLIEDPTAFFRSCQEPPGAVTYPIRCSVVLETLGMRGLLAAVEGDEVASAAWAAMLGRFVGAQPGASHPISDRWALSLVPACALLRRHQPDSLAPWLEQVIVWICDRYERLPGLASTHASPEEEVARLLGDPYEHIDLDRRSLSYLATVVLDLASCLELPDVYDVAFNDFGAVDLAFPVIEPLDEPGMLLHDETGLVFEMKIAFDDPETPPDGWRRAVHHRRTPSTYWPDRAGRSWELLAVSLLLRDRHFISSTRYLAGLPSPRSGAAS